MVSVGKKDDGHKKKGKKKHKDTKKYGSDDQAGPPAPPIVPPVTPVATKEKKKKKKKDSLEIVTPSRLTSDFVHPEILSSRDEPHEELAQYHVSSRDTSKDSKEWVFMIVANY